MAKKKDSNLVQDALIPDEMSPLSLLDFNSSCAKIKQAAVDFRRAVNHKMQLETKDAYLDNLHDSLATFEESAPDYPDPDDDADETDRGEAVDPTTGEIK